MAGFTVWFTGLPAAGKTTIATLVAGALERRGVLVESLDGDVVRTHLSKGLGFSRADRDTNVERIGWVSSRLARAGAAVIVSAVSPYAEARSRARAATAELAPFVEVYVATPLEECIRRDPKGMYADALAGRLDAFTGVSDPYEPPAAPELVVDTVGRAAADCALDVLRLLESRGLVNEGGRR